MTAVALSPEDVAAIARAVSRTVPAAALTQRQAWTYCGISRTTWHRLKSAGKLPRAAKLRLPGADGEPGGTVERWLRKDLDQWLERQKR